MHDIQIDGRQRTAPDCWNALTRKELLTVVRLLYSPTRTKMDLRLRLLCVVLALPLPRLLAFTEVQLAQLLWLTDFIFAGNELTKQLLPSVQLLWSKGPARTYFGPRDSLRNVRFAEFIFADSYFVRYTQQPTPELLNKLVAVLYRPQRRNYNPHSSEYAGDRREDFNEHLIEHRSRHLARLPDKTKLAVFVWYAGCREQMAHLYPLVFTPQTQEEASEKGWDYVLREMSGGAFGTVESTGRQNLHMVLAKMQDDLEAAERIREQQRNQS
ncbi:hypothetical protein [Hymenobacter pini]|uniref:hypothetical protein n=1 Tax=Hymenobacter pini TaxID=2880879 RepID=UPI001CF32203|nr:hypothetical protein [Hymenobacter pini]MCA8831974.1 hypothetical protein [Hymenobacter pini]